MKFRNAEENLRLEVDCAVLEGGTDAFVAKVVEAYEGVEDSPLKSEGSGSFSDGQSYRWLQFSQRGGGSYALVFESDARELWALVTEGREGSLPRQVKIAQGYADRVREYLSQRKGPECSRAF